MGIVDILIIIFILSFGILGSKRGFFKQTVTTVGSILVFVLAYYFKDGVANFLTFNLPFFNFKGEILGLTSLNIIMYQLIAFLLMVLIFSGILAVIIKITGIFEKILRLTIVLGIPSKILGFILGLVEGYVITYIILFILMLPILKVDIIDNSSFARPILKSSPVISNIVGTTKDTCLSIYDLVNDYSKDKDKDKFNKEAIRIMLSNNMITKSYVEELINKGKLDKSYGGLLWYM